MGCQEHPSGVTWQEQQSLRLTEEIKGNLGAFPVWCGLTSLLEQPLSVARRGLYKDSARDAPWHLLPMMVCESLCGQFEPALPLAAAFQFMVTAADVFDDIEDGDCRSSFSGRCGFAVAVNAATALMLIAEQAISQLEKRGLDSSTTIKIYQAFNNHYALACCGQHLDLSLSINSGLDEEAYLQMVSMKSASQIECACHTGALAGKADSNLINLFRAFGRNLGMAAQMNNDLSGILTGKDIVRGKITMPVIFSLQQASEGVREQLLAYYLSPSGKAVAEVDAIKQLLFDCGANYYTLLQQEYYRLKAREALEEIQKDALSVGHLESFVS